MATIGKCIGAAVGGTIGGVLGAGAGIATGGTAIPATIPFASAGAGAGYAIGDMVEDAGTEVWKNQEAIAKAGRRALRDGHKAVERSLRGLSKQGKKWMRIW